MIHNKESIPCIIGSTIGMLGSLIFILVYSFIKEIRDSSRKFIFTLAICDFLFAFSTILPGPSNYKLCQFQAFMIAFTFATSCSLIFLTSLVFYLKICHGKNFDESKSFFVFGVIIIIVICLNNSIIFTHFGKVEPGNSHWCWTTKPKFEALIYCIAWVGLLGTLILYSIMFIKLKRNLNPNISKTFHYKMFALGWIYLFTEIWASIKRGRQLFDPKVQDNLFLDVTQALFAPMLGLWDSVFFVFGDRIVRRLLKMRFKKRTYEEIKFNILKSPNIVEFSDDDDDIN
ncbi:hypothetical protein M0811_01015 [Anaeramoeba ignava]|uniref:G-protein coupled receptors family 2 profile 2 domain-containing protein n=1 Tax=Anaeramoeba ignava TaxID=1746090 RepID=A0A9Q0LMA5_ANAIG|nr:hypothetical protein M0811_01015 [Anaeramoeba ignava]